MPVRRPSRVDRLRTPDEALVDLRAEWHAATRNTERAELAALGQAAAVVADVLRHPADRRTTSARDNPPAPRRRRGRAS